MKTPYAGEIIEFNGGINTYLGELEIGEHPLGPNWYRIKNPCITFRRENKDMKRIESVVASIWGNQKMFRKFVDIRIPEDSILEVKVLDKDGGLYKIYKDEINRIAPERIILPDNAGLISGN